MTDARFNRKPLNGFKYVDLGFYLGFGRLFIDPAHANDIADELEPRDWPKGFISKGEALARVRALAA